MRSWDLPGVWLCVSCDTADIERRSDRKSARETGLIFITTSYSGCYFRRRGWLQSGAWEFGRTGTAKPSITGTERDFYYLERKAGDSNGDAIPAIACGSSYSSSFSPICMLK